MNKLGCTYELEMCNCREERELSCGQCGKYKLIDSGYGYCRALPTWVVTAWCRDICGLFVDRKDKG